MDNQMIFYGTGAAEGVPNPFCRCFLCEHARRQGGRDRRRRSMLRVGRSLCIDMGPDTVAAAMDFGDLHDLAHVLITHTHEDHFYYALAETRALAKPVPEAPLHCYLTGPAYDVLAGYFGNRSIYGGRLQTLVDRGIVAYHRLEYLQQAPVGETTVIPFKGNHPGHMGEMAANYLLQTGGETIYYGVDTGYYLEETFEALRGRHVDILISECTRGNEISKGPQPARHLHFDAALSVFQRLFDADVIDEKTRIYLTHLNHKHTATHEQMEQLAANAVFPCRIEIAYDGMRVVLDGCR